MSAALCFVDTETTGVHPGRLPWEVAMIRRDDKGEHERSFFIGDVDLSDADPFGLRVGRFYERHPQYMSPLRTDFEVSIISGVLGGPPEWISEREATRVVEHWTRGAHIVGAVPNFDTETLGAMLRRHQLTPSWHYHLIDVEALAVGYLAGMRRRGAGENGHDADVATLPWRSDELSLACDVEPPNDDERHTALGDARWAMRLYDAITGTP